MKLTKEYAFDMIEMVGRAVATARQKQVTPETLDGMTPKWLKDLFKGRGKPRHKPGQDEFGLFEGSPWESQYRESDNADLENVIPGVDGFSFTEVERRKLQREWDQYGDAIACQLWELQKIGRAHV